MSEKQKQEAQERRSKRRCEWTAGVLVLVAILMVGPLLTLGLMLRDLRNDFNAQTLQTQLRTSQLQSDLAAFIMNNTEMMATAT